MTNSWTWRNSIGACVSLIVEVLTILTCGRRSQRINTRPKQVDSAGYFGVWRSILRLCSLSAIAETTCLKINRATKGGKREYLSHQGFRLFKWSSCLIDKKVQFCMTKYLDNLKNIKVLAIKSSWGQTWNLSKYLHDQIFVCKNFTHWKRVNWDYFRQQ